MKAFKYEHIVSFAETNLVGNVYFANHIKWQGLCRERFLMAHTPDIAKKLEAGTLALITLHCSCTYMSELKAFDRVKVMMYLEKIVQHRVFMKFEYYKILEEGELQVAIGEHQIGCFSKEGGELKPTPVPDNMKKALEKYR